MLYQATLLNIGKDANSQSIETVMTISTLTRNRAYVFTLLRLLLTCSTLTTLCMTLLTSLSVKLNLPVAIIVACEYD